MPNPEAETGGAMDAAFVYEPVGTLPVPVFTGEGKLAVVEDLESKLKRAGCGGGCGRE